MPEVPLPYLHGHYHLVYYFVLLRVFGPWESEVVHLRGSVDQSEDSGSIECNFQPLLFYEKYRKRWRAPHIVLTSSWSRSDSLLKFTIEL